MVESGASIASPPRHPKRRCLINGNASAYRCRGEGGGVTTTTSIGGTGPGGWAIIKASSCGFGGDRVRALSCSAQIFRWVKTEPFGADGGRDPFGSSIKVGRGCSVSYRGVSIAVARRATTKRPSITFCRCEAITKGRTVDSKGHLRGILDFTACEARVGPKVFSSIASDDGLAMASPTSQRTPFSASSSTRASDDCPSSSRRGAGARCERVRSPARLALIS